MSFEGLLINKSIVRHWKTDAWGEQVLVSTDLNVPCRIMYAYRLIRNAAGEMVVSSAKIFYKRGQELSNSDTIEFDAVVHSILDIRVRQDSTGFHHKEVYVA